MACAIVVRTESSAAARECPLHLEHHLRDEQASVKRKRRGPGNVSARVFYDGLIPLCLSSSTESRAGGDRDGVDLGREIVKLVEPLRVDRRESVDELLELGIDVTKAV